MLSESNPIKIDETPCVVQISDDIFCPLCRDGCRSKDVTHFCSDKSHGGICGSCVSDYIKFKVDTSFLGFCPKLSCPLEHADSKPRTLRYSLWKKSRFITPEVVTKYDALATSLLAFLCGGCHSLKSLSVSAIPTTKEQIAAGRKILQDKIASAGEDFRIFETELVEYCDGSSTADEFYNRITKTFLPSMIAAEDRTVWDLFKNVLLLIQDPERQANLHLRHLRSRPRMWTPCCNREHCFHCKTINFHEGKTCSEITATLDASIVNCPSCGVALAKGDGCNSMTCVCGKQFSWTTEKEHQERSARFTLQYPENTAHHCVLALSSEQPSQTLDDARAWQTRHQEDVNRELIKWWLAQYGPCPSQACAVVDIRKASTATKLAAELWTAGHGLEVKACKANNDTAVRSLFTSLYRPVDRADAAVKLLASKQSDRPEFVVKNSRVLQSARLWVLDHREDYIRELQMQEQKKCSQFLQIYGNRFPIKSDDSNCLLSVTEWDRGLSNTSLTFTNENTTVKRVGGVSSYPAAIAALPAERSMFSVRLDCAPRSSNWISFGLARPTFEKQGTDGIGRTRETWGLHDDRSSSADALVASCREQPMGKFRKLREGDVLTAVVDTVAGFLEISINDTEGCFELQIPVGEPADYVFAMTFANDHEVTILPDSLMYGFNKGDDRSVGQLNREQLEMQLALSKRLRKLYRRSQTVTAAVGGAGAGAGRGGRESATAASHSSLASSVSAHHFTVGTNVVLAPDFAQYSDAAGGPLRIGEVGVVNSEGGTRVNVRTEEGQTWWYDVAALLHTLPPIPKLSDAEIGEGSVAMLDKFVEDMAKLWVAKHGEDQARAAFVAQEELLEQELRLAPPKPNYDAHTSIGVAKGAAAGSPGHLKWAIAATEAESKKQSRRKESAKKEVESLHSRAIFCLACDSAECKVDIGPRAGYFIMRRGRPVPAMAPPAHFQECLARSLREYALARPEMVASSTWANFIQSMDSVTLPSSIKPKKLCLAHPHLLEWVGNGTSGSSSRPPMIRARPLATALATVSKECAAEAKGRVHNGSKHGGAAATITTTTDAGESTDGQAEKQAEKQVEKQVAAGPPRLTWLEIVSAVCWRKLHGDSLQRERAEQEARERAAEDEALATVFFAEHAESAAFIAAGQLHATGTESCTGSEERGARAFARFFPDEMQAWYGYNATLSEPMFGLERVAPGCRCVPRHCGSRCPNSLP